MTRDRLAQVSAWCIAMFAVDTLRIVVEIFGLPLPSSIASMSLSVVFIVTALCILIPLSKFQRIYVFGSAEIALVWLLVFWLGIDFIDTYDRFDPDFKITLWLMPLMLTFMASRLHLNLFGNGSILVTATVLSATLLLLMHTVLLLFVLIGIQPRLTVIGEVMGRNNLASIGAVCLWILVWFPQERWARLGCRYNLLVILVLTNMLISSARMALIELIWCILVGAILYRPRLRKLLHSFLIPACILLILAVCFSYPFVQVINVTGIFGGGDDAASVLSRSYTNYLLLEKFMQNPLLGVGWNEVISTKAFGYTGHTGYLYILVAYGVIGVMPLILILGTLSIKISSRELVAHLLFLLIMITSFTNELPAYLGVIIGLIAGIEKKKT